MAGWLKAPVLIRRPEGTAAQPLVKPAVSDIGEMAEWFKAAVLTRRRKPEGTVAQPLVKPPCWTGSFGSVAEWLKAPVLKTGNGKPFVGSNPTASARPALRSPVSTASLVRGESRGRGQG